MIRSALRIACFGACIGGIFALTACDELGEALGMQHRHVDEGTVETNPPLTQPPNFDLKPPRETPKGQDPDSTENGAPSDPSIHSQGTSK